MTPSQTFHDHVSELRRRLLWCVLAVGASAGIAYTFRDSLIHWLQSPINEPLYYSSPAGSFNFILKLAMIVGIFVALPVVIYNLIRFVEPALPVNITRRTMFIVITSSFLLALAGMTFSYFYLLPMSLKFFDDFSSKELVPLISAGEYLSFMMGHMITFGIMFQIPLVVLFINWITPIKPGKLLKYQRHVIVGAFGLALVLPFTYDPVSQFIVAVPIVVLYYASVILLLIANRGRKKKTALSLQPTVPMPKPRPLFEPVFDALLVDNPQPKVSVSRRTHVYAMDGFASRPSHILSPATPQQAQDKPAQAAKVSHVDKPRPRLSIDGISRPLASYS